MRVVYVAGPFRAPTAWLIEQNVRRAEEAAFAVSQLHAMPLCPHANTRFFHGSATDAFWLSGTMELLRRCDAVYVTGEWAHSEGVRLEIAEAARRRIPVFFSIPELRDWLAIQGREGAA